MQADMDNDERVCVRTDDLKDFFTNVCRGQFMQDVLDVLDEIRAANPQARSFKESEGGGALWNHLGSGGSFPRSGRKTRTD